MQFKLTFGRLPNNGDAFGAVQSVNGKTGAVTLDANDVVAEPLGSIANLKSYVDDQNALKANITYVDSEVDSLQIVLENLADEVDTKANAQAVNQALSLKADLDESGKVPASQLPSYVDDVLDGRYVNPSQFNDLNGNPYTPETGKIYVDVDTNKTYRWSGMLYVVVGGGGVALGETSSTAYRGDRGKIAYDHSQSQGNPHNSTTSDIPEGLRFYFTDARVRSTALTGLNATSGSMQSTDTLIEGLSKVKYTLDSLPVPAVWVSITSVGSVATNVVNRDIQFAKINGMVWIRGSFTLNGGITANTPFLFITNKNYKIVAFRPNSSTKQLAALQMHTDNFTIRQALYFSDHNVTSDYEAETVSQSIQTGSAGIGVADGVIVIQPTPIGISYF
ncbi:hypothetical protein [Acinetobacter sp. Ac_5812]|uniref:hypothetical protein n=1 Tax=Acinetobacter sp. Ac_5812 TaxID=1848937 RepID=UPI001C08A65D|nr:hypothetical protein [Acinetobacter sp. Ac_5812]NNP68975.1 hypothetical protein [Acinetobacter sp. Ac_5812]